MLMVFLYFKVTVCVSVVAHCASVSVLTITYMLLYVRRESDAATQSRPIFRRLGLSTPPQLGFIPPNRPDCYVEERGGTSEPGRAFSLRSDRAESSRGVGPPAAEKENPPFFIVKDAVECDGLISKRAREGNIREERTDESDFGKGGKQKRTPPLASNPPVVSDCG